MLKESMKNLKEFKADVSIQKYVYSTLITVDRVYERYTIFPDGCDYIIFSSKGYYQIYTKKKSFQSFEVFEEDLFIIRLKPYTLHFLQAKGFVFKSQLISFSNEVFLTKSILQQMMLIDKIFFEDLKLCEKSLGIISIIEQINTTKGEIQVEELAKRSKLSTRTLQRRFQKYIALSPKVYIDIIRIQDMIRKIKKIEFTKTGNIPPYYSDYSHFFKTFKNLTNLSPKAYYNSSLQHLKSIYDIY